MRAICVWVKPDFSRAAISKSAELCFFIYLIVDEEYCRVSGSCGVVWAPLQARQNASYAVRVWRAMQRISSMSSGAIGMVVSAAGAIGVLVSGARVGA